MCWNARDIVATLPEVHDGTVHVHVLECSVCRRIVRALHLLLGEADTKPAQVDPVGECGLEAGETAVVGQAGAAPAGEGLQLHGAELKALPLSVEDMDSARGSVGEGGAWGLSLVGLLSLVSLHEFNGREDLLLLKGLVVSSHFCLCLCLSLCLSLCVPLGALFLRCHSLLGRTLRTVLLCRSLSLSLCFSLRLSRCHCRILRWCQQLQTTTPHRSTVRAHRLPQRNRSALPHFSHTLLHNCSGQAGDNCGSSSSGDPLGSCHCLPNCRLHRNDGRLQRSDRRLQWGH
mmetsp:Transcript_10385/g.42223  ORF Transcript_10385/g.42223 Transcript_10385/m.42223 type:complete len:288 (+) Transcript_10385:450-1313(+)